jgi:hypothetical protein
MNEKSEEVMLTDKKTQTASAAHIDELLDEALRQTFPASDPVAIDIEREADECEAVVTKGEVTRSTVLHRSNRNRAPRQDAAHVNELTSASAGRTPN